MLLKAEHRIVKARVFWERGIEIHAHRCGERRIASLDVRRRPRHKVDASVQTAFGCALVGREHRHIVAELKEPVHVLAGMIEPVVQKELVRHLERVLHIAVHQRSLVDLRVAGLLLIGASHAAELRTHTPPAIEARRLLHHDHARAFVRRSASGRHARYAATHHDDVCLFRLLDVGIVDGVRRLKKRRPLGCGGLRLPRAVPAPIALRLRRAPRKPHRRCHSAARQYAA